ncbi:MAG: hypothetical protein OHK006_10160 [Thermodesulfovibrionales bacterium]
MPIYEYACTACGKHHEIMHKITDKPLTHCPACGGAMKKMISNTSFVLKGSGWYKTDYAAASTKQRKKDAAAPQEKDAATPVTNAEKKAEKKAAKKGDAASTV